MKTVSQYLAGYLKKRQVNHVFGFQGSAMLKILDDLCLHGIAYEQGFHEQASAFAACGYARTTGKAGVVIATSGPGAVNLIGGIADAWFDSVPCLFITGQDYLVNVTNKNGARQNGFQDMDIVAMVQTITKYSVMVKEPEEIAYHIERAFWEMEHGRRGPTLIDIPIDVQFAQIDEDNLHHFVPKATDAVDFSKEYQKAAELLKSARRPLVLAGGGIRLANATGIFRGFIEQTELPVVATLNGLDAPEYLYGFTGLYGTTHGNLAAAQADVLLVLGSRLALRQVGKHPRREYTSAKVIHIDIDRCELNRSMDEEISICADLREGIAKLLKELEGCGRLGDTEWPELLEVQKHKLLHRIEVPCSGVNPVRFIKYIYGRCKNGAICTADIGQNQMWVAQAFAFARGYRLINSGGYGSMGFSLPAAIGAACGFPEETILCFTGDGGLHMNMQELEYLTLHQPNIKCIVLNNGTLGLMREVSAKYYDSHYFGNTPKDFRCADLSGLAQAYRLAYCCIDSEAAFDRADTLIAKPGPCIIECALPLDAQTINRYDEAHVIAEYAL